jgi:16S rRNA (cytosine967-C5)-methyltransferase
MRARDGSEPRATAARVLAAVMADRRSLSASLPGHLATLSDPKDRALAQEICYGVLRWLPRLDFWLRRLLTRPMERQDPIVLALLLAGLYQARYLHVPPHAAVAATAEACRRLKKAWAVPLVNAVLRRFLATREASIESPSPESARFAHPEWLLCAFRRAWPRDWEAIAAANNQAPPMAIRVNSRRAGRDAYRVELRDAEIPASPAPYADQGLLLASPIEATALPGFRMGAVSVQDTAAQLAAPLLDVRAGHYVLDACAAPGGKAAHLLEISPTARLVALDKDPGRLVHVSSTLERLGLQARVMTGDAADPSTFWDGHLFDRVLVDAPCSGTGVIRRHPDIKVLRRPSDIARMAEEQSRMLAGLWPLLAPRGKLLYATCSVLPEENAHRINAFLAVQLDARLVPIEAAWGRDTNAGRQILPGEDGMDGFFYALLEKVEGV